MVLAGIETKDAELGPRGWRKLEGRAVSPRAQEALRLLSLSDAFYLLNQVVDREYRAWEAARGSGGEDPAAAERLSRLLGRHLETFGKLVRLAREGHFDLREMEEEQPRLPAFEAIDDERKRKELMARYERLLEEEERLLSEVSRHAGGDAPPLGHSPQATSARIKG